MHKNLVIRLLALGLLLCGLLVFREGVSTDTPRQSADSTASAGPVGTVDAQSQWPGLWGEVGRVASAPGSGVQKQLVLTRYLPGQLPENAAMQQQLPPNAKTLEDLINNARQDQARAELQALQSPFE